MGAQRQSALVAAASVLIALVGCESDPATGSQASALHDQAITVASFDFPESVLLAEIYGQALQARGFDVRLASGLGPREFVQPALARGLVEFVPEYSGSALQFLSMGSTSPTADSEDVRVALGRILDDRGVVALAPALAQNANVIVVPAQVAARFNLRNVSDLAAVASRLTFGGPPECPTREYCLAGLERVYGLAFAEFLPLDAGGPLTHQALAGGHVDVALLFATDPSISTAGLVVLADDRGLQRAENVIPLIRRETVELLGDGVARSIDAVSARLTTTELRALNSQVAQGSSVAEVANRWLAAQGLA